MLKIIIRNLFVLMCSQPAKFEIMCHRKKKKFKKVYVLVYNKFSLKILTNLDICK